VGSLDITPFHSMPVFDEPTILLSQLLICYSFFDRYFNIRACPPLQLGISLLTTEVETNSLHFPLFSSSWPLYKAHQPANHIQFWSSKEQMEMVHARRGERSVTYPYPFVQTLHFIYQKRNLDNSSPPQLQSSRARNATVVWSEIILLSTRRFRLMYWRSWIVDGEQESRGFEQTLTTPPLCCHWYICCFPSAQKQWNQKCQRC